MIRERTIAGLAAVTTRGRFGGRPKTLDEKTLALVIRLHADQQTDIAVICRTLGISCSTLYRVLKQNSNGVGQ